MAGTAGWVFGSTQPVSGDVNGDGAADLTLLHAAPDAGVNLWGVWGAKSSAALTGSPSLIKSLSATSGWRYAYAKGVRSGGHRFTAVPASPRPRT